MAELQSISTPADPQGVDYRDVTVADGYKVGDDGSVWSCWRQTTVEFGKGTISFKSTEWRRLKTQCGTFGYRLVSLRTGEGKDRHDKMYLVHRLVLLAFRGEPAEGQVCCHIDNNPANNALTNLRWDTQKENIWDQKRAGTFVDGSRNGKAKIDEAKAAEVKRLLASGMTAQQAAEAAGVSLSICKNIKSGACWAHVEAGETK